MPLPIRKWMVICGIAAIFPLPIILLYAPPDGLQRGVFAQFMGRFHPLAIHLPIALILLVPALELAALGLGKRHLRQSVGFVLGLATAAAIASAWLGWMLAWSGGYEGPLVTGHMWGGVSLAGAILACWVFHEWKPAVYFGVMICTLGLLIWTSDQGGKLTHGDFYLTKRAPDPLRRWLGSRAPAADRTSFYATRVQPIFEEKCVLCHNDQKFKGKLRLDTYEHVMRGGKDGAVIKAGDPTKSELFRRVTLQPESKDFMPAEGKPALTAAETKLIERWIASGAATNPADAELQGLPAAPAEKTSSAPIAPDYRSQSQTIASLESSLGIRLLPRSQNPTDGLILRTASAPARCDDATLAGLAPVANLIVDAELARTKVTDKGMQFVASFSNLRFLDLSRTAVTSAGMKDLAKLNKLERLNLTQTQVTEGGIAGLKGSAHLKSVYLFEPH